MSKLAISHATLIGFPGICWGFGEMSGFGFSQAINFSRRGVTGGDEEGEFTGGGGGCDWEIRVKSDIIEQISDLGTSSFANMVVGWGGGRDACVVDLREGVMGLGL